MNTATLDPFERALSALRKIGTIAIIGTVLAGGIYVAAENGPIGGNMITPPAPPPPPGTANLWVDTNGGACIRQASPTAYADANACGSLPAAYNAASVGDTVLVMDGTYGDQEFTDQGKTGGSCDGYASDNPSGCITFAAANGPGHVTLGVLHPAEPYVHLKDFNVGSTYIQPGACSNRARVSGVVLENLNGGYIAFGNVSHVGIIGGDFGDIHGSPVQMGDCGIGFSHNTDHIRFSGVWFHDAIQNGPTDHLECVQSQGGGTDYAIFEKSRFTNCAQWDISGGFRFGLLIQNNTMTEPCSGQSQPPCSGGNRTPISLNCAYGQAGNLVVRFNSMRGGMLFLEACTFTGTNAFYGNSTDWPISTNECNAWTNATVSFDYNVFASSANGCGSHQTLQDGQWVNGGAPTYNFHLASCSVASANKVPTSVTGGYPATDISGVARPRGTNLDAGAYEDCS